MLEYIFGTVRYICTEAYIGGTSSHVQRLLVHVHMYTMYYLSVALVLLKDVTRLCSSGVKSWKPYMRLPSEFSPFIEKKVVFCLVVGGGGGYRPPPLLWRPTKKNNFFFFVFPK